jgi:2-polyprenyl-6-methoxyphenol hydroxylase-like FAD-dependent oxidoreductase
MKIAVVGSGPAGLTAAYRLQQADHQVEVLEALDVMADGRTQPTLGRDITVIPVRVGWLPSTRERSIFSRN